MRDRGIDQFLDLAAHPAERWRGNDALIGFAVVVRLVDQQTHIRTARMLGDNLAGLHDLDCTGDATHLDALTDQVKGHAVLPPFEGNQPINADFPADRHVEG